MVARPNRNQRVRSATIEQALAFCLTGLAIASAAAVIILSVLN